MRPAAGLRAAVLASVLGFAAADHAAAQSAAPDAGLPEVALPEAPAPEAPPGTETAVTADPQTLADSRADLAVLGRALQSLRAELVASGPKGFTAAGGTAAIERMDRMEAEIARLTGQVEELRKRVEATIAEAGNRAGDIEFRLCEMEAGCDLGALTTTQLQDGQGGIDVDTTGLPVTSLSAVPAGNPADDAAFDRAVAAAASGDQQAAAAGFAGFIAASPSSPLVPEAMFLQGEALAKAGDKTGAARAWLDAFTVAPSGPRAAPALLNLAGAMAEAGQKERACGFYADVPVRFPATPAALDAVTRADALGCTPAGAAPAGMTDPEEAADLIDGG